MKTKIWGKLYGLPKEKKAKAKYYSRKQCEKVANERGFEILWDWYGRGKHKVKPDPQGGGICEGSNDVMERLTR